MPSNARSFLLRTLGFSALAGIRSLSPPALLSLYLAQHPAPPNHALATRLRTPAARVTLGTLALGELMADKFPQAPNRTLLPALLMRMLTGGGTNALMWSLHQRSAWIGAAGGAGGALAMTYLTFYLRQWLGRILPLPHAVSWAGLLEDGLVWGGGWWLLTTSEVESGQ
jgi:uncharacterized membrane protein